MLDLAADPVAVVALALLAWGYGRGLLAWRRRGVRWTAARRWRAVTLAAGLAALAAALLSPVDALAAELLAVHMTQHVLLLLVAAPLLVLADPVPTLLAGMSPAARGRWARAWSRLTGLARRPGWPLLVVAGHGTALWLWHLPGPYQAALQYPAVHALEHGSFLGAGLLFWWSVLASPGRAGRYGTRLLVVVAGALQGALLGVLMTFSQVPWYPAHVASATGRGVDALADQQVAGALMWGPSGLVYVAAGVTLLVRWLRLTEDGPAPPRATPAAATASQPRELRRRRST